jgi:hypothetical protein
MKKREKRKKRKEKSRAEKKKGYISQKPRWAEKKKKGA